jgi:hypothetical protein
MNPVLMETVAAARVRSMRNEAAAQGRTKLVRLARRSHCTTTATATARPVTAPRPLDAADHSRTPAEHAAETVSSGSRAA